MIAISVVILTYNEEKNLKTCLESVSGWADEIFVVDSFSNDSTEKIARNYTENFIQHRYESHPAQWNWALQNLPFRNEWIFAIDADWQVTPKLKAEISRKLTNLNDAIKGIYVRHREVFRGRFIKHGTIYPRYWLRLFRRGFVFVDTNDLVDLHFYVQGEVVKIEYDVIEENAKEASLEFWINKQVKFAQRAAVEELKRLHNSEHAPVQPTLFGTPDQRTLWLKNCWYHLPLYWRSVAYFVYRYIMRLGFLDGRQGFLYHFTQALVYRLMIDARIEELQAEATQIEELIAKASPLGVQTK